MLDETNKLPNDEKSNLTLQNSEIKEASAKNELNTEELIETDDVTDTADNDNNVDSVDSESEKIVESTTKTEVPIESNKAIDEIDTKIAESSENFELEHVEMQNYDNFSLEDLVAELSKLVKEKPVQSIHNNVNKIKNTFNVKFGSLLKEEKTKFLEEGGNVVDFQYNNPIKSTYNSILYDYKIKKNEFYTKQENQLNENLQAKLELIEDLKTLIENADGTTMYKKFKDIQDKWRSVGPIPKAKYNDTWRTYQHHVERFYDLLHLNNDLRDLDFKHNYEEKLKLVVKAEALAELDDINLAFNELQILHKMWKEEIGPVDRAHREEVWGRFSAATKIVHDKRHDFFKDLRSKFDENLEKKLAIITEIEAVDTSKNNNRSDWQKSINEIEELRNKFFKVGQVPRAKSNDIWAKFKAATRKFNVEKNNFFKGIKKEHLENLNKKKLLIEKAVELKESEDWDVTTEVMKKIQADWKNIGHVPRKYSDKLWKEFKDACNYYFDRLHSEQDAGSKEQLEVFNKKKELLKQIKESVDNKVEITLEKLKEYVNNWRDLGRVPFEMKHIEIKFNKLIDRIVAENSIDVKEVEMIKFENLINSYLEQKNYKKLNGEQLFVRKKIDDTIREIQQLENNIGFISNATKDNPLLKNVMENIRVYKEKLEIWKSKLAYLKKLDY